MPSETVDLTSALKALGGQRVWSLIISVFGDLAPATNTAISGPVLSEIMAGMDVKPQAMRVALHRLRNDGWITSRKSGRTSEHSLTPYGQAETRRATHRIYATPADMPADWHIILAETSTTDLSDGFAAQGYTPLTSRVFVGAGTASPPEGVLVLHPQTLPNWLKVEVTPGDLMADYERLHSILIQIDQELPQQTPLRPVEVAVLRCLIVHNWRRLVLKHPDLPETLYTSDWRGQDCRALVSGILSRLPKPDLADLSQSPNTST